MRTSTPDSRVPCVNLRVGERAGEEYALSPVYVGTLFGNKGSCNIFWN
jgi:hypothetical protein